MAGITLAQAVAAKWRISAHQSCAAWSLDSTISGHPCTFTTTNHHKKYKETDISFKIRRKVIAVNVSIVRPDRSFFQQERCRHLSNGIPANQKLACIIFRTYKINFLSLVRKFERKRKCHAWAQAAMARSSFSGMHVLREKVP
eukprot:jgi/Mesvir1/1684/Mv25959-RA.1